MSTYDLRESVHLEMMGTTTQEGETKIENDLEGSLSMIYNKGDETRGVKRRRILEEDSEDEPSSRRRRIEEEQATFLIDGLNDEDQLEEEAEKHRW